MTEQKATPIPEERGIEDTELKNTAEYKAWELFLGVHSIILPEIVRVVADAAVAKCAPLIKKKAREEIYEWGIKYCQHDRLINGGRLKRECFACWQALKEGKKE